MDEKKKISRFSVILSFLILFLPNVLIFDLLPDFIACFLLASVFRRGEDAVPYFAEAKTSLLRLGYLNLAKILGIAAIFFVRSKNASDYDILALVCTVFAAAELVLSVSTVKNAFDALFYLGERSDASALISWNSSDAEPVRALSYFFVTVKCLAYSVPQFFALSKVNENGSVSVVSNSYPALLLIFFTLALSVGIAWLLRMLRYAKGIRKEGLFEKELDRLEGEQPPESLAAKREEKTLSRLFLLGTVSCFCLFTLRFESLDEINLLPHALHAVLLLLFGLKLCKLSKAEGVPKKAALIFGFGYTAVSFAAYLLDCVFYAKYKYPDTGLSEKEFLLDMAKGEAGRFYRIVIAISGLETLLCLAFVFVLCLLLWRFIPDRLGRRKTPTSDFTDDIKRLRGKCLRFGALTALSVLANFAAVLLDGAVRLEEILQGDGTTVSTVTAALPWFDTAVFALVLLSCAFGVSFFRSMKEEMTDGQH